MSDDTPPPDVQEAAAKVQAWIDSKKSAQPQRVESAIDRFKRTVREDCPNQMPDWDRSAITSIPPPDLERAINRFNRLRLSPEIDQSKMPKWRDPRSA